MAELAVAAAAVLGCRSGAGVRGELRSSGVVGGDAHEEPTQEVLGHHPFLVRQLRWGASNISMLKETREVQEGEARVYYGAVP
jgi:hypothetical protein